MPLDIAKLTKGGLVDASEVKSRTRKGYTSELIADIEAKLKAHPGKAYAIQCQEPLSPRHLANVLRQRIGKDYVLSSSEPERTVWVERKTS